jgi:proteasome alpha subunit
LANAYSESIGNVFTSNPKPLEVEILVVEVGQQPQQNEIYHISFDGSVTDYHDFAVIGGQADRIRTYLHTHYTPDLNLPAALAFSRRALLAGYEKPPAEESALEVGVLDRHRPKRSFYRLSQDDITQALRAANGASE